MIGYILTIQEYYKIQGKFYSEFEFFNCIQDINDIWFLFLSDEDKFQIEDTEWSWILNLPEKEYISKPSPERPY